MTTIKLIPRKEGDRIFCYELVEKPKRTGNNTVAERHDRQKLEEYEQRVCAAKTYPILPTDSAWFEQRLGQVVDVVLQGYHCKADRDGDCKWKDCPQLVEHKTHCPLDLNVDLDPEDDLIDTIFAIPPKQDLCKCDQYLQMQAENERLKGLIETAWNDGEKAGLHNYFCAPHNDMTFEQFKTEHNL